MVRDRDKLLIGAMKWLVNRDNLCFHRFGPLVEGVERIKCFIYPLRGLFSSILRCNMLILFNSVSLRKSHTLSGKWRHASVARSGTAATVTHALCRPRVRVVGDGRGVVYEQTERFPCFKPGHSFGRNLHHLPRFRVAACARRPVAEPEAPKPPQFHLVPSFEGLHDALEEQLDHRCS